MPLRAKSTDLIPFFPRHRHEVLVIQLHIPVHRQKDTLRSKDLNDLVEEFSELGDTGGDASDVDDVEAAVVVG